MSSRKKLYIVMCIYSGIIPHFHFKTFIYLYISVALNSLVINLPVNFSLFTSVLLCIDRNIAYLFACCF